MDVIAIIIFMLVFSYIILPIIVFVQKAEQAQKKDNENPPTNKSHHTPEQYEQFQYDPEPNNTLSQDKTFGSYTIPHELLSEAELRIQKLKSIIQDKNIEYLYHFTPVSNLDSILKYGLLSRKQLNKNNQQYNYTDPNRIDGLLDRISCSIMWPNTFMLNYKKQEGFRFVIIQISKNVLYDLDCLFFPGNAAKTIYKGRKNLNTVQAFENMFNHEVNGHHRTCNFHPGWPTDTQAEVLVLDHIPPEYFTCIITDNEIIHSQILHTCDARRITLKYNPTYFGPRDNN